MTKYMIHACPDRMWYVDGYLLPSLAGQGIDAEVWLDRSGKSRTAYIESFRSLEPGDMTWHLQDDVAVCHDFKERTLALGDGRVYCGFCSKYDADAKNGGCVGEVEKKNMWYSFPCIGIPNSVAIDFAEWFEKKETQYKYQAYMPYEKYEDELFRFYLIDMRKDIVAVNVKPNLADHIDYLLGGSTINRQRHEIITSLYFDDSYIIEELKQRIVGGR